MGCVVLIVLGVLFEVVGLGLVAWQLWRVQRREFGMPAWVLRARARLQRLTGRSKPQFFSIEPAEELGVADELTIRLRREPGVTVDSRLDALETNLGRLEQEMQTRFERHKRRQDNLQERIDEAQAELQRQQEEREGEQREQLRESMTLQWWGTGVFFIGAVLAGVANGVS
jgi:hypothetical protein